MNRITESHRPTPRAAAAGVVHRNSFELNSDEIDVLLKLQNEYTRLESMKCEYSHDAARKAFDAVRNQFIEDPSEENRKVLRETELNRPAFFGRFEQMSRAIGQSLRRHTALLEPEVASVLKRLRPFVAEDLAEARQRERGLCATYRIEFEASVVTQGLESLLADLDATISNLERGSNVTASPRSLLGRFDIELRTGAQSDEDEG
jgi:hypothetical protein